MKPIHAISLIVLLLASAFASCSRSSEAKARLDAAEALIVSRPDSAMAILCGIDTARLVSKADRAQFALLMSMALDKSYVDTTSFAVLQPAIDYYLKKGTPDQKLRTYYYQGRIYQNRHEYDSAMVAFIRGKEYSPQASDTLTAANLLVAEGNLLYDSNIIEDFIDHNLIAAKMYREIGRTDYEASSFTKALTGTIMLLDEQRSDSIASVIENILDQNQELASIVTPTIFRYIAFFGDKDEVLNIISGYEPDDINDDNMLIDIAHAYYRFGDAKNTVRFLEATSPDYKHGLRYKTTKAIMYDINDDIAEAFKAYREATAANDSLNKEKFYNDLLFLQERHAIEKSKMQELRNKDKMIWISLCVALAMLVAFSFIYYRYRLNRAKSEKLQLEIEQLHLKSEHLQLKNEQLQLKSEHLQLKNEQLQLKSEKLQLEREKLQLESENMQLESEKLQLERNAKALEAENLAHRVEVLESESEKLKALLDSAEEMSAEVKKAIQTRIQMLNSILAVQITNNEEHGKEYDSWINEMMENSEQFMNSTRLAFQATHPGFIQHLNDHGLSADEINYACLYAIGLNGREVGSYMHRPSHIHISAAIRKKLGLDMHKMNLSTYIRRLVADN